MCLVASFFNILLEVVIALALENNESGASISGNLISNLRFADDICLVAISNDDLQQLVDAVHTTSSRFGLTVSSSKTVVQSIGKDEQQMKIMLGNCPLEQCQKFVYLGGLAQLVATLIGSTKLLYAGPG